MGLSTPHQVTVMGNIICITRTLLVLLLKPFLSRCWNKDFYYQVKPHPVWYVLATFVTYRKKKKKRNYAIKSALNLFPLPYAFVPHMFSFCLILPGPLSIAQMNKDKSKSSEKIVANEENKDGKKFPMSHLRNMLSLVRMILVMRETRI